MAIDQQPFRLYNLDGKKADIITVRLNDTEREQLEKVKRILKQPKDSTAIKQMFIYGVLSVLHDQSIGYLLKLQFKNEANSQISGNFTDDLKNEDL